MGINPVTTEAQDAALDAAAKKMGLPSGPGVVTLLGASALAVVLMRRRQMSFANFARLNVPR
jgi:hypothetical protein